MTDVIRGKGKWTDMVDNIDPKSIDEGAMGQWSDWFYVIQVKGPSDFPEVGAFLSGCDPEGNDGKGLLKLESSGALAKRFASPDAAQDYVSEHWQMLTPLQLQSVHIRLRMRKPDGSITGTLLKHE